MFKSVITLWIKIKSIIINLGITMGKQKRLYIYFLNAIGQRHKMLGAKKH